MDGEILHFLDGLPMDEPLGWQDFQEELDRDLRERIISVKYASELTFTGKAYAYLRDAYAAGGYCKAIQYEAKQRCGGVLATCAKGDVILADAEWNLTRCEVRVSVVDNGIGARIINNKDIPVSPTAEASKNDITIAPVPTVTLSIHDPQGDGTDMLPDTRRVWDWYEAIKHAVKYITDDTVAVTSSWYEALDDAQKWALVEGFELREHTGANNRTVWTFKQLFDEMAGRFNLWMWSSKAADGTPLLRIEPESYFYGAAGSMLQLDIQDLTRTIDQDRLYARVVVGCDTYIRQFTNTPLALPYVIMKTHGKEEYHFKGICNTSETLELSFDFISDSNAIEDVVLNGNDEYDEDIFLLQYYDGPLTPGPETSRWMFSPDGVLTVWPFNEQGLNAAILERYYLPSPVGANFGPQSPFLETLAANTATDTLTVTNDQTSPATLFASDYTASVAEYAFFEVNVPWRVVLNIPQLSLTGIPLFHGGGIRLRAQRYNASNVLEQELIFDDGTIRVAPGIVNYSFSFGFSLNPGDYVRIQYQFLVRPLLYIGPSGVTPGTRAISFDIPAGATFQKTFSDGGGFADGLGTAPMVKYTFERHLSLTEWLSLTSDVTEALTISHTPQPLAVGWVSNAKRNCSTGACEWEVTSFDA